METEVPDGFINQPEMLHGHNDTVPEGIYTYPERVIVGTFLSLVVFFGTTGNAMVIVAVILSKKLQTPTNVFVVSLSIADIMSSLFTTWIVVALLGKNGWPLPRAEWLCSAGAFVSFTCAGASIYHLAAISFNRMILITKSFETYQKIFTLRNLALMIAFVWTIPFLTILLPPLFGIGGLGYDYQDTTCTDLDYLPKGDIYNIIQSAVIYPLPVIILIVCYTAIYVHVRRHFKKQRQQQEGYEMVDKPSQASASMETSDAEAPKSTRRKQISKQEVQITKNLFTVLCVFLLCTLGYFLSLFIPGSDRAAIFTGMLVLANGAINPLVYASKHPHFKIVLRKLLQCRYKEIPEPSRTLRRFLE